MYSMLTAIEMDIVGAAVLKAVGEYERSLKLAVSGFA